MVVAARSLLGREVRWAAPRWVWPVTLVLALIGLGLSTYLTVEHFTGSTSLYCSGIPGSNCLKVTTSAESYFLGIPVSVLGLAQYVAMVALCSPWAWRSARAEVHLARLLLATVGMCFVLWLITAEVVIIKAICLYCTGVHIVTFLLFVAVVRTVPVMLGWADR
jgi:uncharacterized membrane protein